MLLGKLDQEFSFNATALKLRGDRQALLTANFVQSETPNYKAQDFDFRAALQNATQTQASAMGDASKGLAQTQPGHLPATNAGPGGVSLQYRVPLQASIDGNTVDVDQERAQLADNAVRYEASLRILNGQLRTLQSAMQTN